jgi:glycerol-3-phosphate dehydrogenase
MSSGASIASNFSALNRRSQVHRTMAESVLDLLVVGGGIVGAGVARDAALRGWRVGLVDQHDFAFGTSSRSSRLLHGGLRYLAQGRVGLVREASMEKKVIHEIAPHLAQPLPFVFPAYRGNRHWVLWQLKIGVKIYDLLCGGRNLGQSSWMGPGEVLEKIKGLSGEGLKGAVRYYDGFTNDARLVIDTLRSAQNAGAILLNYCRFLGARRETTWACDLEDVVQRERLAVSARTIVNATGPWADGLPHSRVRLRLTKGVHLVIERGRMAVPETVVMTEGKRILFAIPWGGRTILGTTDTDYDGPVDDVRPDQTDIDYILGITNQHFPGARLGVGDVISAWAGLRPLPGDPNGKPSDISRAHQIRTPEPGWWDVTGGKLTTYRLMAEQVVDQLAGWLRREGGGFPGEKPCRTAKEPLLPEPGASRFSGVVPPAVSREAVEYFVSQEWCIHLDDLMVRRSSWHHYLANAALTALEIADWMAEMLGWPPKVRKAELERYMKMNWHPAARPPADHGSADRFPLAHG